MKNKTIILFLVILMGILTGFLIHYEGRPKTYYIKHTDGTTSILAGTMKRKDGARIFHLPARTVTQPDADGNLKTNQLPEEWITVMESDIRWLSWTR